MHFNRTIDLQQFTEHHADQELIGEVMEAFYCVHKLHCDVFTGLQTFPENVSKLLDILLLILTDVGGEHAKQQLAVRAVLIDNWLVETFCGRDSRYFACCL